MKIISKIFTWYIVFAMVFIGGYYYLYPLDTLSVKHIYKENTNPPYILCNNTIMGKIQAVPIIFKNEHCLLYNPKITPYYTQKTDLYSQSLNVLINSLFFKIVHSIIIFYLIFSSLIKIYKKTGVKSVKL